MNTHQSSAAAIIPEDDTEPDYLIKIILVGDSGVGKTNLLSQFARNQFSADTKTTIGVEFATKTIMVNGKVVKAQIWDTAGQERFRSLSPLYYRQAAIAILVYSVVDTKTFDEVSNYIDEINSNSVAPPIIFIVGNKIDKREPKNPNHVQTAKGEELASRYNAVFMETSAKNGSNVNELFIAIADKALEIRNPESFQAHASRQRIKKCC